MTMANYTDTRLPFYLKIRQSVFGGVQLETSLI